MELKINKPKDARDVDYKHNLDKYFEEISDCTYTTQELIILNDMYKEIKKLRAEIEEIKGGK